MKWLRSPHFYSQCVNKLTPQIDSILLLFILYSTDPTSSPYTFSSLTLLETLMSGKLSHMSLLRDREADLYAQHV